MNEYEATIQINPTDDIKFMLEESGCYESEIEMMKAGGTYDAFVKRVHDAIDWSHLFERMAQMENETITATIDKLSDSMIQLSGGKYYVHSYQKSGRRKHELAFPEYRFQRSTGSHEN